jgi:CheY-like chemotaxis protein
VRGVRKKRAIVFDDEPVIRELLEVILERRGFEVIAFREPVICPIYYKNLDTCKNVKPCADILITDNNLPNISGVELLMRQYDRGCQMDIRNKALISGYFSPDDMKLIDFIGFKHLNKPFTQKETSDWLDECEHRIDLSRMVGIMRRHERSRSDIKIAYEVPSYDKAFEGIVKNISIGGLCLNIPVHLLEKEFILIDTALPNNCRKATVRWVNELDDSSYAVGLCCR